jgi:hypothetical protein
VEDTGIYRVLMDERWALEDLYGFPHTYSQAHAFIYHFDSTQELDRRIVDRISRTFNEYPWRGGFSYVNLYTVLSNHIPNNHRPTIQSIQYASPGWIDLLINPDVAIQVAQSVGVLLGTGVTAAESFKQIDRARLDIARRRREQKREYAALTAAEAKELNEMAEELAKNLGFSSLNELQERAGDPDTALKVLMAHYRRMRTLGDYVESGKVMLPEKLKDES